ncbi:hypothetical protein DPMN_193219 [Dreissena polymorpha]|uniref:Uncharacterized protein n=1 Tax=Dreissena polymorpha TaxID=45954 RepID=A0A9D3Y6J1_DREPO|nr:hypothetical protein DPMN_193219 [Dreissena polymorpha]
MFFNRPEPFFNSSQDIIGTNLLTKFHEDPTINVAATAKNVTSRVGHAFLPIRHIQKTHVLTKFHEDWTKNVTTRVFTCFHYIHIEKNAPPPGGHISMKPNVLTKNTAPPPGGHLHEDWASNVTSTVFTSFKLSRGINGTNVLTKFHEDRSLNVASRVFTRQNVAGARRTTNKRRSQKLTFSTLCSDGKKQKSSDQMSPPTGGHVFPLITTIFELIRDIHKTNHLTKFHDD